MFFFFQGKYSEAGSLYKRAQAIQEEIFGPEHPDVAQSLNNRAGVLYDQVGAVGSLELSKVLVVPD